MNVSEMSDRKKSVMLARLCGWQYRTDGVTYSWYSSDDVLDENGFAYHEWQRTGTWEFSVIPLNLYDPANMALAWRVLNWAMGQNFWMDSVGGYFSDGVWQIIGNEETSLLPPADAQRAWLDMVLTLATEAGMVTK